MISSSSVPVLPVGKTGVKIPNFSALRGCQTGSKGAEKQRGGEPQRQFGRCLSGVVQIGLCLLDDVRNPLVGIRLTKSGAGRDDLRHIGAVWPGNIAIANALRQDTRNFAAGSSQIGGI